MLLPPRPRRGVSGAGIRTARSVQRHFAGAGSHSSYALSVVPALDVCDGGQELQAT